VPAPPCCRRRLRQRTTTDSLQELWASWDNFTDADSGVAQYLVQYFLVRLGGMWLGWGVRMPVCMAGCCWGQYFLVRLCVGCHRVAHRAVPSW